MKKLLVALLLFVAIIPLGFSQVQSNLELLDIFNMEYVSDPQISPDGSKIIYVRNFKDVMTDRNLSNLWIINFDGSNNRPLTTGNHNDFAPKWSHDGTKIVFKSNMADDKMKLYLMWLDTKETMALTNTPQSPGTVSWSYDDKHLAFNMFVPEANKSIIKMPSKPEGAKWNEPPKYIDKMNYRGDGAGYYKGGNSQLFSLPISGGTPKQLTFSEFDHGSPIWSKDGKNLFFSANFHKDEEFEPADSEIYSINVNNGDINPLTDRYGPDANPVLSPDGSKIAYLGYDDRLQGYQLTQLYVMNTDGTGSQLISGDFDRDVEDMAWNSKGNGLYFSYTDQGMGKLASMSLSGKVDAITDGLGGLSLGRPYNAASFSASANNKFAYTLGDTSHPSDLGVADTRNTERLTQVNNDLFSFKKLGNVEEIWWKSSYDQRKIQGWVVTPPDFDPSKNTQ